MRNENWNFVELHRLSHERCFELTGDSWCPHMSEIFMQVIIDADDDIARKFIEKRRTYLFPSFLSGEPMWEELERYMEQR